MALKFPDRLESNNPAAYGVVKADQISGHKTVKTVQELYSLSDAILSASGNNTNNDAIGQQWYIISENCFYELVTWENKKIEAGWRKVSTDKVLQTNIDKKVDKVQGKSLVSDLEITKLTELLQKSVLDGQIADAKQAGLDAQEDVNTLNQKVDEEIAEISNPASVNKNGLMSKEDKKKLDNIQFSTDENSIWFNGKKYSTHLFKNKLYNLSTSSSHADITEALNGATFSDIKDFVARGIQGVVMVDENPDYYLLPVTMQYSEEDNSSVVYFSIIYSNHYITDISIDMTSSSAYKVKKVLSDTFLLESDIINSLASQSIVSPLSAAMGKKLNDEKLAKTDVVNNLTTTDATKALSAAQGKVLNDKVSSLNTKLSSNIIVIDTNSLPEDVTTEDQIINEALGVSGIELYNAFKSGATIIDSGDNIIYPSRVEPNHIVFNVLYLLDESTVYTKMVELYFSSTGQYNSCRVTSYEYPIPVVENSLSSSDTTNALSAAQGKVLNDKITEANSEIEKINNKISTMENMLAYGVEWDINVADPHITRIGNMSLHKTLPIQSQLKGCIAQGGNIIYWLDENDWRWRKTPIYTKGASVEGDIITINVRNGYTAQQYANRMKGAYIRGYNNSDSPVLEI